MFLKLRTLPPLHLQTRGYEGCCMERGTMCDMWYHAYDCRSDAHPTIMFALASFDLHNFLYNTAKHAEPQLYRLVLCKLVKNVKYIRWTLLKVLSVIKTPIIKPSMYALQWTCSWSSVGSSPSRSIFSLSHFSLTCEPMSDSPFTGGAPR